jgi:hypothetical protein
MNQKLVLSEIWILRRTGQVVVATARFKELLTRITGNIAKDTCGFDGDEPIFKSLDFQRALDFLSGKVPTAADCLDVLLFMNCQQLRAGEVGLAQNLLQKIDLKRINMGLQSWYQLEFQKALTAAVVGQHGEALEFFRMAESLALTPLERVQSRLNSLISAENLGLLLNTDFDDMTTMMASVPEDHLLTDIRGQFLSLKLRFLFETNQWEEIQIIPTDHIIGAQSQYFYAWLIKLPWTGLTLKDEVAVSFARQLGFSKDAYQGNYRMGTLLHISSAADQSRDVRVGDMAGRLYLWLWTWLLNPNESAVPQLFHLSHLVQTNSSRVSGATDALLIKNALGWLAVLRGIPMRDIEASLEQLQLPVTSKTNPQLQQENEFLLWLDGAATVPKHHIDGSDIEAKLLNIFKFASNDKRQQLCKNVVVELQKMIQAPGNEHTILVDARMNQIFKRQGSVWVAMGLGEAHVRLFVLFESRPAVAAGEVMRFVFGVTQYEAVDHDPRLLRFLHGTNKALQESGINFSKKGELIHLDWNKDVQWMLRGHGRHALLLGRHFQELIAQVETKQKSLDLKNTVKIGQLLSRKDIQDILGVSKATSVRQIEEWVQSGAVKLIGKGPSTKYEILDPTIFSGQ